MAPACLSKPPPAVPEKPSFRDNIHTPPFATTTHSSTNGNVFKSVLPLVSRGVSPDRPVPDTSSDVRTDDSGFFDITDEEIDDLAQIEDIWQHSLSSEEDAPPPPACSCHQLSRGSCPTYKEKFIDQIVKCQSASKPNMDGARIPLLDPSFPAEVWRLALGSYFDADELVAAISFGWDIDFFESPRPKDAKRNNASALKFPEHCLHYVQKELVFGSLVGPFRPDELPFPFFRSPFGSVDKTNSVWRRTVTDCSQLDLGINAFIDPKFHRSKPWKLTLPNTMAIVREIVKTREKFPGQRVYIWKADMSRWYRWILLDPACVPFFAVQWDDLVYLDAALSFGNRGSALAAQRFMWAVAWMYRTRVPPHQGSFNQGHSCRCTGHCDCGENSALVYIDDTLGFSPQCLANDNFSSFLALADHLGLRMSTTEGHMSPPSTVCICLGLEYDTVANTVSLPQEKVTAFTAMLQDWLTKTQTTEKQLASLAGKLLNASNVFFAGRLFVNRVLATKRRAARLTHKTVYIDEDFRDDLKWWSEAINLRNGVSFLVHMSTALITLDASTHGWAGRKPGIGAYHYGLNEYISVCPPSHLQDLHINDLELLAHVLVVRVWGARMQKQHITIKTDNESCYFLLSRGRSSFDNRLRMARIVSLDQIANDYRAESAWISTSDNWLADALTRSGSGEHRRIFDDFVAKLGVKPRQRQITPEMYMF